jgi:hypothetical protein
LGFIRFQKINMSRTAKVIGWIIVIIIVVIIGKMIFGGNSAVAPTGAMMESGTNDTGAQASAGDSSDVALNKDMAGVDAQMNGLNSDSANADQSLSAK